MRQRLFSRMWFYFRQGWGTYFAFLMAAINTLTVTYYLAIENIPTLKEIFPSFVIYIVAVTAIGVPVLILVGYVHFKKSTVYSSESDIIAESYPYYYKLTPGIKKETLYPAFLMMMEILQKIASSEKLTDDEKKEIEEIKKKMNTLINGGHVGTPPKRAL